MPGQIYLTITDVYESIEREYNEYHNTKQNRNDTYLEKYVPKGLADAASYGETKITEPGPKPCTLAHRQLVLGQAQLAIK
jgi:hypothetical protein